MLRLFACEQRDYSSKTAERHAQPLDTSRSMLYARPHFLVFLGSNRLIGLDVLVEPQDILGVVLSLDFHQASIVRPIRCPDELLAGFA
jgi:hypothetical protein